MADEPAPLKVVSIGGEMLSGAQAELLFKAVCRAAGDLGTRVAQNRYDEDAVRLLADASRIASLLYDAVPKKVVPKAPPAHDD